MIILSKTVFSSGSATIINAISTGFGSAFGIGLGIEAEAKFSSRGVNCSSDVGADPHLMNLCVEQVFDHYKIGSDLDFSEMIENLDFGNGEGIEVKTKSNLPLGSGLSSSSALSNAVVMATAALIAGEFCLEPLTDMQIINFGIEASLEAGVTITGAFDDATASFFGGVTVTDNLNREIWKQEKMPDYEVLVFMPNEESLSGSSDVNRMKLVAPFVSMAFEKAMDGYNTIDACHEVELFIDALNNWYIRRNKERFWKKEHDNDKQQAYEVLHFVLKTFATATAPVLPFLCEEIYQEVCKFE